MSRTVRSEADIIADVKRYARATAKRAKRKRREMIDRRVRARVDRLVEAKAQAIADRQMVDAKPDLEWHETWRQKRWSFL